MAAYPRDDVGSGRPRYATGRALGADGVTPRGRAVSGVPDRDGRVLAAARDSCSDVPYWVVPVVWLASAPCCCSCHRVQVARARPASSAPARHRRTSSTVIAPIWRDLAARANLPQYRYVVRVIDSDELNAFACGGHLVVVTSFAIEELTARELSGVLAHELSHHLGLHTVALTLGPLAVAAGVAARHGSGSSCRTSPARRRRRSCRTRPRSRCSAGSSPPS